MNETKLLNSRMAYYAIILLCSFAMSYYLWSPNLHAAFGIHEDHLIVGILGEDRLLTLAEFPTILAQTDMGGWGESLRFRPAFWELKLFECWLWGDAPFLWYLSHIAIFFLWFSGLWHLLSRYVGLLYSGLFMVSTLLFPFWPSLFAWLAPSEVYAVMGLALYVPGLVNYWQELSFPQGKTPTYLNTQIALMIFGGLITIGSKENFVILLLPTLLLQIYAWGKKRSGIMLLLSTIVQSGYALFITSGILLALSRSGSDIYQRDVNVQSHSAILLRAVPETLAAFNMPLMYGILMFMGLAIGMFFRPKIREYAVYMRNYAVITGVLALVYLSQIVFYSGQWPASSRYDFPGVLMVPLFYFFTMLTGFKVGRLLQIPPNILHTLIGCALIVLYFSSPYRIEALRQSRQRSIENAEHTREFQRKLHELIAQISDSPELPLIFESFDSLDYEAIFSLQKYLSVNGIQQNPLYLLVHPYPEDSLDSPIKKRMAANLQLLHKFGGEGFLPLRQLADSAERCFAITFSGETQTHCDSYKIWDVKG